MTNNVKIQLIIQNTNFQTSSEIIKIKEHFPLVVRMLEECIPR